MATNEKKCWACSRILVGKDKLGLCPDCVNKFGTPVAAAATLGLAIVGKQLIKNGGKIARRAAKVVNIFKG